MTRKDGLLALLVVVVWGLNFVVIKVGLHNMPPLMLAGLRFLLVAFPALLFVARPKIPLSLLLGYGLTISFGQFAFLFCAISLGMPAGLAPLVGFMLTLAAALSWACGNIFNKKIMSHASRPPIMSLVVWSALIPVLPFMLASWILDGPQVMAESLLHIDLLTILSLLGRYETWRVAPLSLLVPVVGMASAALLLGETLNSLQLLGAVLIMAGLYINVFGLRIVRPGMARG